MLSNIKKTQEQLGAVHLKLEGLDKERFKKLVDGHNFWDGEDIENEFRMSGIYIENCIRCEDARWVVTYELDKNSRLITIDELEQLLVKQRTPEVIQAEIELLQQELAELTKVKVGDVVITNENIIGVIDEIAETTIPLFRVGNIWYKTATKIDPNKTVKEILGL